MMSDAAEVVTESLSRWAQAQGVGKARVSDVRDLGGHSGETWGFTLHTPDLREALVLRIAPVTGGARAADDLLRQAPLLQALHAAGAKVAQVRECGDRGAHFRAPYMIVTMLAGRPLVMGPAGAPCWLGEADRQAAYEQAAAELARFHALDLSSALPGWGSTRSPGGEIDLWARTFERAAEPDWASAGKELADALRQNLPENWTTGICHGDFQTNNVLFVQHPGGPAVSGVVDWEIAHFGATELDLAWLLMMNDAEAWHPVEQRGGVDLGAIVGAYEAASGRAVNNLAWFRALACYKIAAIAGYKIHLHRSGRKRDAAWEQASSSVPRLIARAHAHLTETPVTPACLDRP